MPEDVVYWLYVAAGIGLMAYLYFRNRKQAKVIRENGVRTRAVVSRISMHIGRRRKATCHVKFRTRDGQTVEALLCQKSGTLFRGLKAGDEVQIRYDPEKPDYAVEIEDE